jgi:acyl-CoA dehydrogenase
MKLFALRASDYMRSASETGRRYLLFNPMVKMKVTTEGEHVINHGHRFSMTQWRLLEYRS